jgi:hypothetical protein
MQQVAAKILLGPGIYIGNRAIQARYSEPIKCCFAALSDKFYRHGLWLLCDSLMLFIMFASLVKRQLSAA